MVNFMSEGERQKNKRLLKGYRELALRKKGEELLAVLPQGEDSGLDADMVDGMHAEQIIAETLERIGFPKKGRPTFGGGGMTVHGNEMHAPNFHAVGDIFADVQYPNALLLDGTRAMTGNLDLDTNKLLFKDILLKQVSISDMYLTDRATETLSRNLRLGTMYVYGGITGLGTALAFYTRNANGSSWAFYARDHDIATFVECARLLSASEPEFGISRAGDITQLLGKTSKLRAAQIGDAGTTNYANFATDGELTLKGTARIIKGRWVPAQGIKAPGVKPATYVDIGISGAWEFSDNQEEIIVCNIKIPDNVDMNEDIKILVGWSSPAVSLNCDWEVAYLLTKLNDPTNAAAQQTLQSFEASSPNANGLVIATFTIDNATQIEATDVCIHINIMRDGNDAGDTLGAAAHIHGICLEYTSDKLGVPT